MSVSLWLDAGVIVHVIVSTAVTLGVRVSDGNETVSVTRDGGRDMVTVRVALYDSVDEREFDSSIDTETLVCGENVALVEVERLVVEKIVGLFLVVDTLLLWVSVVVGDSVDWIVSLVDSVTDVLRVRVAEDDFEKLRDSLPDCNIVADSVASLVELGEVLLVDDVDADVVLVAVAVPVGESEWLAVVVADSLRTSVVVALLDVETDGVQLRDLVNE